MCRGVGEGQITFHLNLAKKVRGQGPLGNYITDHYSKVELKNGDKNIPSRSKYLDPAASECATGLVSRNYLRNLRSIDLQCFN